MLLETPIGISLLKSLKESRLFALLTRNLQGVAHVVFTYNTASKLLSHMKEMLS